MVGTNFDDFIVMKIELDKMEFEYVFTFNPLEYSH